MPSTPSLREKFKERIPMLRAWGMFVFTKIERELQGKFDTEEDFRTCLQISFPPRIKEENSFVEKACLRGKNYRNPIKDIEDQVGVRFVVLLSKEIAFLRDIILENKRDWTAKHARDMAEERKKRPSQFEYQSEHFILKSKGRRICEGQRIEPGTACEVQIRTLLQHAYCELSHKTVYKKREDPPPNLKRWFARSMALIETTDDILLSVDNEIEVSSAKEKEALSACIDLYKERLGTDYDKNTKFGRSFLAHYKSLAPLISTKDLADFFQARDFIFDRIRERIPVDAFFRQPVVLAVYFLLYSRQNHGDFTECWPLYQNVLEPIATDLGIPLD